MAETLLLVAGMGAVELWAAVPTGLALGLHPLLVAAAAAAGAVLGVLIVVSLGEAVFAWIGRGHGRGAGEGHGTIKRIWRRHGVVGLGLLAPLLVGAPLGAALGLALGAPRRQLLIWMSVGAVLWSSLLTLAAVLGLAGLHSAW